MKGWPRAEEGGPASFAGLKRALVDLPLSPEVVLWLLPPTGHFHGSL